MMDPVDEKIVTLEMRATEQQRTLDELSQMIAGQWRKIDELALMVEAVRERIGDLEGRLPENETPPPPHY